MQLHAKHADDGDTLSDSCLAGSVGAAADQTEGTTLAVSSEGSDRPARRHA
jgi:hypothetical protein